MDLIQAPPGFHYRGQEPKVSGDPPVISKLAKYLENEEQIDRKVKYQDIYFRPPDANGDPLLRCLVCQKDIKCTYYSKSTNLDFGNMFKHLQSQHPSELTPRDQKVCSRKIISMIYPL